MATPRHRRDEEPEAWPTLGEVRDQLRIPDGDTLDEALLTECRDAARQAIVDRLDRGELEPEAIAPPVRRAAVMLAARLFKRRDSLDGSLGMPDVGLITVNRGRDNDIEALITPYRRIPVA